MKFRNRIAALLLSLVMILVYVPTISFAEEGTIGEGVISEEAAVSKSETLCEMQDEEENRYEQVQQDEETALEEHEGIILVEEKNSDALKASPSTEYSGNCGEDDGANVKWKFDPSTGELTITGSGRMDTCNDGEFWGQLDVVPWYNYREQITSVSISEGVTFIGWWAFAHTNITEITLPSSVKELGQGALAYCSKLKTVNLNDGLETIDGSVFDEDEFDELVIPESVSTIKATALRNANIASIHTRGDNPGIIIDDGVYFGFNGSTIFYCEPSKNGSYEIPEGVTTIDEYAFMGSNLEHVIFPLSLKTICGRAFAESALKEVDIPDNVTSIDYGAFTSCTDAASITIGSGITEISTNTFGQNSSLKSVKIGDNVKTIGLEAFADASSLEYIEIPDSVSIIDSYAFVNCTSLMEVKLGNGVKEIRYGAFYGTSIESVVFPSTIITVEKFAFPEATVVTLPYGLFKADDGVYYSLSVMAPVEISVKYGQSEARGMLTSINGMRTGNDAWYWNENNTQKEQLTNLASYTYDYELEKIAMQRAAEIAVSFSHTRPDGSSCFTAYNNHGSFSMCGENIAIGQETAADAFTSWAETSESYSGQGHRRNMLSSYFNTIGIGHVICNGVHCWVQEFGYTDSPSTTATDANDSSGTAIVNVNSDSTNVMYARGRFVKSRIEVGETTDFPPVEIKFETDDTWGSTLTGTVDGLSWTASDPAIASINDGVITGVSNGVANFTAPLLGTSADATLGVGTDPPAEPVYGDEDDRSYVKKYDLPNVKILNPVAGKKSLTVKWKKLSKSNQKKIKGIEIQVATDKNFKKIVIDTSVSKKASSKKIKGLKKKKKYWVRVRAYKSKHTDNLDEYHYSKKWSAKKAVKTK